MDLSSDNKAYATPWRGTCDRGVTVVELAVKGLEVRGRFGHLVNKENINVVVAGFKWGGCG